MNPEELMRAVIAAFEKGDMRPLMDSIHPDIVWKSAPRTPGAFSFGGSYEKRSGVLALTSKLALDYTFLRLEPKEIVSQGNSVWGLFDAEVRYTPPQDRARPRTVNLEIVFRWRLREGKIVEHQSFFDTASLLEQSRG